MLVKRNLFENEKKNKVILTLWLVFASYFFQKKRGKKLLISRYAFLRLCSNVNVYVWQE